MHYSSSTSPVLAQPTTVYKFRMTAWAWILVYQCVVMALPALKLLHVSAMSDWSWGWVTLPIWAPSALLVVVLAAEQVARLGKANANNQLQSLVAETSAAI